MENKILFSNCSEATMRINAKNLTISDIKKLTKLFDKLQKEHDDGIEDGIWFETGYDVGKIFGHPVITISGNAPYNSSDELIAKIKETVSSIKDEDIEVAE